MILFALELLCAGAELTLPMWLSVAGPAPPNGDLRVRMGGVNKTRAVGPCACEDLSPGPAVRTSGRDSVVMGTDVEWRGPSFLEYTRDLTGGCMEGGCW